MIVDHLHPAWNVQESRSSPFNTRLNASSKASMSKEIDQNRHLVPAFRKFQTSLKTCGAAILIARLCKSQVRLDRHDEKTLKRLIYSPCRCRCNGWTGERFPGAHVAFVPALGFQLYRFSWQRWSSCICKTIFFKQTVSASSVLVTKRRMPLLSLSSFCFSLWNREREGERLINSVTKLKGVPKSRCNGRRRDVPTLRN